MTARLLLSASLLFTPTLHALAQYRIADTIVTRKDTIVRLAHEEADFNKNGVDDKLILFHDIDGWDNQLWIWDDLGTSLMLECGQPGDDGWASIFGPEDFKNELETSDARLAVRSPDNFLIILRNPQMRSYEYESWDRINCTPKTNCPVATDGGAAHPAQLTITLRTSARGASGRGECRVA